MIKVVFGRYFLVFCILEECQLHKSPIIQNMFKQCIQLSFFVPRLNVQLLEWIMIDEQSTIPTC